MIDGVSVYLVRHGAVHNPTGVRYGRLEGFALSSVGRTQIQHAAQWLAARDVQVRAIVRARWSAARQSADIIAERLRASQPVTVDDALIEARSRFDGLRYRRDLLGHLERLVRSDVRDESPSEIADRVLASVRVHGRAIEPRSAVVIVSHQLPIQYARRVIDRGGERLWPWGARARSSPRPDRRRSSCSATDRSSCAGTSSRRADRPLPANQSYAATIMVTVLIGRVRTVERLAAARRGDRVRGRARPSR